MTLGSPGRFVCSLASSAVLLAGVQAVGSPEAALQASDAKWRAGIVTFTETDNSPEAEKSAQRLVFSSSGRFKHEVKYLAGPRKGQVFTFFSDGKDRYFIHKTAEDERVVFDPGDHSSARQDDPFQFVYEAPCLASGRGLSNLRISEAAQQGDAIELRGERGRNETVTAIVDPRTGLARSADISINGKLTYVWKYGPARKAESGWYVPTSTLEVPWAAIKRSFVFTKVEFREPTPKDLELSWFTHGRMFQDNRSSSPMMWNYPELLKANKGQTSLTPEALFALSQARAHESQQLGERNLAVERQKQRDREGGRFYATLLAIFAVVGVVATVVLSYVQTRRAPSKG